MRYPPGVTFRRGKVLAKVPGRFAKAEAEEYAFASESEPESWQAYWTYLLLMASLVQVAQSAAATAAKPCFPEHLSAVSPPTEGPQAEPFAARTVLGEGSSYNSLDHEIAPRRLLSASRLFSRKLRKIKKAGFSRHLGSGKIHHSNGL